MTHVLRIEEVVASVLRKAQEQPGDVGVEAHNGLEMFEELRREFPQATIVTISLAELLEAVQASVESRDEEEPDVQGGVR